MLQTRKHQKTLVEEFKKGRVAVLSKQHKPDEESLCGFIFDNMMPDEKSLANA